MATIKLLHLLFLFIWIGSLLTLSRFVAFLPREEERVQQRFLYYFRRMYLWVEMPSMIIALALGWVLFVGKKCDFSQGWLHMKLTFAALLIVCDVWLGRKVLQRRVATRWIHHIAGIALVALLASVYIVKNRVSPPNSLAKKETSGTILPLEMKR